LGNAADFGAIMRILVNDNDLKNLMNIPISDQTNYGLLIQKYFLQTYISEEFTDDGVCRLLIRSSPQSDTNNPYVKFNGLIIEIYVPKSKDLVEGFQTRINQISDRLQSIFNHVYINDNKLIFNKGHDLPSATRYFKRHFTSYEYKKIYK
jgi:hypothetical protein